MSVTKRHGSKKAVFGYLKEEKEGIKDNPVFSTNPLEHTALRGFNEKVTGLSPNDLTKLVDITKKLKEYVLAQGLKPDYKPCYFLERGEKRSYVTYQVWNNEKKELQREQIIIPKKYDSPEKRKAFAEAIMQQVDAALVAGYHLNSTIKHALKTSEAVELYLAYKLPLVRATKDYRTFFNNFFSPYCEEKKLHVVGRINKQDIVAMLDFWQKKLNWSPITRNTKKRFVYNFFEYMKERHGLGVNPAQGIQQQKENSSMSHTAFQSDEMESVRELIRTKNSELYLFTQFIYYTFMRPKEIRLMRLMDINLSSNTIRIRKEVSKSKTAQTVQIPNALKELILDFKIMDYAKPLFVFSSGGKPGAKSYSENVMTTRHRLLLNEMGYGSEYSLYSWKHTGCCALYTQTKDIELVQRQCRHTDIGITQIYLRQLGVMRSAALLDFK